MTDCNHLHSHPRDSRLRFRASDHTYHFGDQVLRPVTSVVEGCFPKFDVDRWAPIKAAQLGISEQEMRHRWEEKGRIARDKGTLMHANIERYYLGQAFTDDFDTRHLFEAFEHQHRLQPFRTEWAIYDEDLGVAGTIDFLEYKDGRYRIYDWKRSDKLLYAGRPVLSNSFGSTGLGVLSHVPDTAFWHYTLQVSIYRYILGRKYGIEVENCYLAVLHPNNTSPFLLTTPYLEKELHLLFPGL